MNDDKCLVILGGGKNSLGEQFEIYARAPYSCVFNFNLDNGFDCTDPVQMMIAAKTVAAAIDKDTELHIVNFVGMMDNGKVVDYDNERFKRMMFVNIYSLFVVAKAFIELLAEHHGRFITLGSNAGEMGFTGMSAYCTTKHAAQGFIKCMAKEMAPYDVPCNIVNPGAFENGSSRMSTVQVEQFMDETGKTEDEVNAMLTSRIPMKRMATNLDLNRVLFALLNHYPTYYTGQAVSLSGGMVMR
jgi:2-keto-3-deoxy-L-fuconate dehydrogenase